MINKLIILGFLVLAACSTVKEAIRSEVPTEWTDLSMRAKPTAITDKPWKEVVINVTDLSDVPRLFKQIGGFETLLKSDSELLLKEKLADGGFVHFFKVDEEAKPARPATSRAWDKGCYFSLMMRAKNLPSIIEDARALGWTPLTELAYLEFGPSKLNIIVLTHESGVRVQLYERLTTPLPEGFTPFERISRPFNVMQMVEDRDATYDFFQQKLGFDTFFYGKPHVSEKQEVMPLGIPPELTTTIPYKTGIMTPKTGLEYGRMEMIDIEGMPDGVNYAESCNAEHTGIIKVRFEVEDIGVVRKNLRARKVDVLGSSNNSLSIKTPDGSNIEFYQE